MLGDPIYRGNVIPAVFHQPIIDLPSMNYHAQLKHVIMTAKMDQPGSCFVDN